MNGVRLSILLGLAGILIGCGAGEQKPGDKDSKVKDATAGPKTSPPPAPIADQGAKKDKKPSEPGTAVEVVVKEYVDNEDDAKKKYKDKELVVEGTVIDKNEKDFIFVVLDGGKNKKGTPIKVKCNFPSNKQQIENVGKSKKGDKVKIKGEFSGVGLSADGTEIEMIACKFVD